MSRLMGTYAELMGTAIPNRLVTISTKPWERCALTNSSSLFSLPYLFRYSRTARMRSERDTANSDFHHALSRLRVPICVEPDVCTGWGRGCNGVSILF